jgi:pyruvate dehydrogenase E2 component (dihydrolipoamide acetyltransferase)
MTEEIRIPPAVEGGKDIIIFRWLYTAGAFVEEGDVLAEVEADKGVVDITATSSGVLVKILKSEGEICSPGEPIAEVRLSSADESSHQPEGAYNPSFADPRMADIEHPADLHIAPPGDVPYELSANQQLVRRAVEKSNRDTPVVRFASHIFMERPLRMKKELGVRFDALYLHFLGQTLLRHPEFLRYCYAGPGSRIYAYQRETVDVSFAVAQKERLYTPAVKEVDKKSPKEIDAEMEELIWDIAEGAWRPPASTRPDGCMLLSNLGMFPVTYFDALIYPGQSSSLAVGQIEERLVPVDGEPAVRKMCTAVIAIDHRILNGKDAAVFLQDFKRIIENGTAQGKKKPETPV